MKNTFNKFKDTMSNSDFIDQIIYLDSLDNDLCEYDEHRLANFYNNLYKVCKKQIDMNIKNSYFLINRGETIGEFMYFLKMIGL